MNTTRGKYPMQLRTRVSPDQLTLIRENAEVAGMSICAYLRHKATGGHIIARMDATILGELRRLGGLLKLLASQGHDTEKTQAELRGVMRILTSRLV